MIKLNKLTRRRTLINTLSGIFLQLATIINGFITPRLILSAFGSETNGLIASLTQFLNYIALIEGGLSSVIMAKLYKPLAQKDYKKVGSIIHTANSFFRKIAIILIAYTLVLATTYPIIFKTNFSWSFIFTLTIILSIKLFTQYCFSISLRLLLNADKRVSYVSFTQIALIIIDTITAIIVIKCAPNIHLLKALSAIIYMSQPLLYARYIKKHYPIQKSTKTDRELLKSRWDGLAINIAYFIHSNTDVTIISIFRGLKDASVYSVYLLITNGITMLCQSIWKGLTPSIGKTYAENNITALNKQFDTFEFLTFYIVFTVFSVAGLLITPFVMIYTTGISDTNYFQPLFGSIILIAEGINVLREPYLNIAYNAGKFKEIRKYAILEAVINIVVSLLLVNQFGLVGIAVGTLVAMSYRALAQMWYLRNNIINRPLKKSISRIAICIITAAIVVPACAILLPLNENTISAWIINAIIYTVIIATAYLLIGLLFFKKEIRELKQYIIKK